MKLTVVRFPTLIPASGVCEYLMQPADVLQSDTNTDKRFGHAVLRRPVKLGIVHVGTRGLYSHREVLYDSGHVFSNPAEHVM